MADVNLPSLILTLSFSFWWFYVISPESLYNFLSGCIGRSAREKEVSIEGAKDEGVRHSVLSGVLIRAKLLEISCPSRLFCSEASLIGITHTSYLMATLRNVSIRGHRWVFAADCTVLTRIVVFCLK